MQKSLFTQRCTRWCSPPKAIPQPYGTLIDTSRGSPFYILTDGCMIDTGVGAEGRMKENVRKENQERQSSKDEFLLNSSISAQNSWRSCFFLRRNSCCFQILGLRVADHKPFHSRVAMWGAVLTAEIPLLISEFAHPTNSCMSLGAGFKFLESFFCCTSPPPGSCSHCILQSQQVWAVSKNG